LNEAHEQLGHANEDATRATAYYLTMNIRKGNM